MGVVNQLLSNTQKEKYVVDIKQQYEKLRLQHKNKKSENSIISIEDARRNKHKIDWRIIFLPNRIF